MQDLHEPDVIDVVSTAPADGEDAEAIAHLLGALERGVDWPTALLQTMSMWRTATETIGDRRYNYFIGGEAFDWLLMAERLCDAAGNLIPQDERDALLFSGRFPESFDSEQFKELLGVHKHSGFLNYYYGVVVEEALQLAVEREVHKRAVSNGNQYQDDFSEEAFFRIYRRTQTELLHDFCADMGYINEGVISLGQCKEFLYWLFKYRMYISDKAKVASDTRKGIAQLRAIADTQSDSAPPGYAPQQP